jgi:hypothetical protein
MGLSRNGLLPLPDKWLFAVPGLCDNHGCGYLPHILIDSEQKRVLGASRNAVTSFFDTHIAGDADARGDCIRDDWHRLSWPELGMGR